MIISSFTPYVFKCFTVKNTKSAPLNLIVHTTIFVCTTDQWINMLLKDNQTWLYLCPYSCEHVTLINSNAVNINEHQGTAALVTKHTCRF